MNEDIQVRGVIQGLEATSFQYGTHGLYSEDGELLYALHSDTVRLDDHTGESVHLHGTPDADHTGGAVEGGPGLLNVTEVHGL